MDTEKFVGHKIDRYRILRHIASGGMADVYLAEDEDLARKVALKIMLDTLAIDPQFVQRFRQEARTVARLDHPNIVQVYTVGETPTGRPYIAMQYIEGGSLREKLEQLAIRGKLLTIEQALNVTRQIALALGVAHQAQVVHRDLKPANVLIRPDGTPVLVDLGIAVVQGVPKLTQTGGIIGTPHYMSPEQVRGLPLDGRSDLYSLGIILYEMLAGVRPFEAADSIAVLHQQAYEEPVPLGRCRPDLSPELLSIVETCLQKEPARRFQRAEALVAVIDRALLAEGQTGPNPHSTQVLTDLSDSSLISRLQVVHIPTAERLAAEQRFAEQQLIESTPRRTVTVPVWVMVTLAVLATAVIAITAMQFLNRNPNPPPTTIPGIAQEVTAVPEVVEIVATQTDTPELAATDTPELETAVSTPLSAGVSAIIPPSPTLLPTPIPAQNKIVFQSNRDGDFEIFIMDSNGGNQIQLTENDVDDNYPAVSPDGRQIAFQSYRDGNWEVYTMTVDGSQPRRVTNNPTDDRLPTWSPDGQQLAFISDRDGDFDLFVANADGSNVRQVTHNSDLREGHVSWSVDNRLVYNAGTWDDATWEIYTIEVNGQNPRQLTHNNVSDWSPEWSPDGRFILYLSIVGDPHAGGGDDPAIFIMNGDGSGARQLYNSQYYEWGADWSADGSHIIFTRDENDLGVLYAMNADGSNLHLLTERGSYPSWVR
ncbi:MAG: serine/threonine-protein kinase [Ardenticatenaceae bacterium]|nr:serine/threonine-protein kinase [Ardenticatenaceae bacterium]